MPTSHKSFPLMKEDTTLVTMSYLLSEWLWRNGVISGVDGSHKSRVQTDNQEGDPDSQYVFYPIPLSSERDTRQPEIIIHTQRVHLKGQFTGVQPTIYLTMTLSTMDQMSKFSNAKKMTVSDRCPRLYPCFRRMGQELETCLHYLPFQNTGLWRENLTWMKYTHSLDGGIHTSVLSILLILQRKTCLELA